MIRIVAHSHGPRLYIGRCRVHHGVGGAILAATALGLKHRRVAFTLACWAATDYRDFPFRDCNNH